MINRILWIDTKNTYPYRNLGMEEYMTTHVPEGVCILFLWQNRHTVVIGKNQNCWRECKVNFLEDEGGFLVRRLSGGGAVFHDLGNLNFTFIVRKEDYDVDRQLQVILEAVRMVGIETFRTGRNDITVQGRKFSGNAFYTSGGGCYHHGTLMLHADKENMSRYLNVSKEKLATKGVLSVNSRVANLCEFNPDLSVERMKEALVDAFSQVYGLPAGRIEETELPEDSVQALTEKFESWQWKYGRRIPFEYEMEKRFPWGGVQMQFHVDEGRVQEVNIYSDAMDQEMIEAMTRELKGCRYDEKSMCRAVEEAEKKTGCMREPGKKTGPMQEPGDRRMTDLNQLSILAQMKQDIASLIKESL